MRGINDEPLPEILSANYSEFWLRISDLPVDYGGWLEVSEYLAQRVRKNKLSPIMIVLAPAEFDFYWNAQFANRKPTIKDLVRCARDKASGYGPAWAAHADILWGAY